MPYMDWKTIFINISSDYILINSWNNYQINIHRNFVEESLWKELVKLYREIWFKDVIILNWPGWFTNLRVGTLCLNVFNTLLGNQLSFYGISKIDLYKKAYEKWFLSKYWIVYIWQKRNVRLRDFEKNEKIWQYPFDELKYLEELNNIKDVFIDDVYDNEYYPEWMKEYIKYHVIFEWKNLVLVGGDKKNQISIEALNLKELKSIAPNYMMEPNITIPSK